MIRICIPLFFFCGTLSGGGDLIRPEHARVTYARRRRAVAAFRHDSNNVIRN
jgi:hypothetical protein